MHVLSLGPPSSPTCVVEDERIVIAAGRRNDKCKFVIERVSRPRNPHHRESDPTIAEKNVKAIRKSSKWLVRVTFNPNAVKKKHIVFFFLGLFFVHIHCHDHVDALKKFSGDLAKWLREILSRCLADYFNKMLGDIVTNKLILWRTNINPNFYLYIRHQNNPSSIIVLKKLIRT